jgi:hypothetical protein
MVSTIWDDDDRENITSGTRRIVFNLSTLMCNKLFGENSLILFKLSKVLQSSALCQLLGEMIFGLDEKIILCSPFERRAEGGGRRAKAGGCGIWNVKIGFWILF